MGALRHHPKVVSIPTASSEGDLAESTTTGKVQTLSPSKSELGIYPREIPTRMHIIHSFRKDFLSIYYMPGTVLGSEDISVNKRDSNCCPHET